MDTIINEAISGLVKELEACNESINRTKDEINIKRRALTELQNKQKTIEDKIKAKKLECLESLVSDKLGISINELAGAVENGDILVERNVGTIDTNAAALKKS